ncbi:hypothetical protein [Cellulosimicrobium composti]|uniref:hypothetical protein n=1 Tax=Cellulosimicrobium composti TaxID=2672572 RepID=UPI0037BA26EF
MSMAPASGGWWTGQDWADELALLDSVCADEVVLQWTAKVWAGSTPPAGIAANPAPVRLRGRVWLDLFGGRLVAAWRSAFVWVWRRGACRHCAVLKGKGAVWAWS